MICQHHNSVHDTVCRSALLSFSVHFCCMQIFACACARDRTRGWARVQRHGFVCAAESVCVQNSTHEGGGGNGMIIMVIGVVVALVVGAVIFMNNKA